MAYHHRYYRQEFNGQTFWKNPRDLRERLSDQDSLIAKLRDQLQSINDENNQLIQQLIPQRADDIQKMETADGSSQPAEERVDHIEDCDIFSPAEIAFLKMTKEVKELEEELVILRVQRDQNEENRVRLTELRAALDVSHTNREMLAEEKPSLELQIKELKWKNCTLSQMETASQKLNTMEELSSAVEVSLQDLKEEICINRFRRLEREQWEKGPYAIPFETLCQRDPKYNALLENNMESALEEMMNLNNLLSEEEKHSDETNQSLDMQENEVMEAKEHQEMESEERTELLVEEERTEVLVEEERTEVRVEETEELQRERGPDIANRLEELNKCLQNLQQERQKNVKKDKKQKSDKDKKVKNKKEEEKVKEPKEKPEKRFSFSKFFGRLFCFRR